jgi:ferric-dicitrate binding protein FerR (iron transport regulator)
VAIQEKSKAVLILSDGRQIPLDSAGNGQVAEQGSVKVVKSNGEVRYQAGNKDEAVVYNTMATPRGGQYMLVLPDGTKVWLNAASSLRYPTVFSEKERQVELKGEAYFAVAPGKEKPFVVHAGKMAVRVLGTEFDVMAYEDEAVHRTTLVQGKVLVSSGSNEKVIANGEQAVAGRDSGAVYVDSSPDLDKAVAWRYGFFKFNDTDIRALMREISRWYDIEVEYGISDYAGKFGGRIDRSLPLPELLNFLELNNIHHYKLEGRKLIVLP